MEAIKTGMDPLNRLLGGWHKRVVTLLVGETGVGKSTLLMATALGAAIRGVKTLYIDVEGNLFGRPFE